MDEQLNICKYLQSAVRMILRLNVKEESQSSMITLTKSRTQYTFSQEVSLNTQHVLTQFIQKNMPNAGSIQDRSIHEYLAAESTAQLEAQKTNQMIRHLVGPLYFILGISFSFLLWSSSLDNAVFATPTTRTGCLCLLICVVLLLWFNRISFPEVREKLNQDSLTLLDCEYVFSHLRRRLALKVVLYIVCIVMVIIALSYPAIESNRRQLIAQQQNNNAEEEVVNDFEEIDILIEKGDYIAALEIAETGRSRAYKLRDAAKSSDDSLVEQYANAMKHVYRCYVSGYWIGKSSDSKNLYIVYYIPIDRDTEYYAISSSTSISASEAQELIRKSGDKYLVSGCSLYYAIGAMRSVSYYTGYGQCSLELDCASMSEGTIRILGSTFERLIP